MSVPVGWTTARPAGCSSALAVPRIPRRHRRRCCPHTVTRAIDLHVHLGLLDALSHVANHTPLALERVVFPCQSMNCGDALYRRCASVPQH
jgi:hypothetical protein